jgi:NAD(P)-dependent dehydrogenase (short-subunit alcohol dehydrogenase family)
LDILMTDLNGSLDGHVTLITGGNSGIGLGMARGLAKAGAHVGIWGTNQTQNEAATEELSHIAAGTAANIHAWQCDVADEESVESAMADVVKTFGRVDSCFASAGVPSNWSLLADMTFGEWHRVLGVNLDGVFLTMRAVARDMIERGEGGSLVAISSLAATAGQARGVQYSASKGGVVAMMRACAVELARYGIRANTIIPGSFRTPMAASFHNSEKVMERIVSRIPLRRVAEPDEMAAIAVYLASPGSSFHTGDTLVVDGGQSIA